jgi:hypothetical protein
MTTENTNATTNQTKPTKPNGQQPGKPGKQPRVISHPGDVAGLVMMQIDAVNTKKDELTIAAKGLADTAKQLVRAYAQQAAVIQKLQKRVTDLEEKASGK